jgi:hypothetical protein
VEAVLGRAMVPLSFDWNPLASVQVISTGKVRHNPLARDPSRKQKRRL